METDDSNYYLTLTLGQEGAMSMSEYDPVLVSQSLLSGFIIDLVLERHKIKRKLWHIH